MNNYPPGVSDNTFGAPYNDIDYDFTLIVRCSTSFRGPLNTYEEQDAINDFTNELINSISKIEGVDNVEIE